jgi:hypothetical protein
MMIFGRESTTAYKAVECGDIHCIFETVVGKEKCVEFVDLATSQGSGLDRSHWQVHLNTKLRPIRPPEPASRI